MTASTPNAAPQTGDYYTLRHRVVDEVQAMHTGDPAEQKLAAPELCAVIRAASLGVLRQLQEQGIGEAGTLAIRLSEAAERDDLADLSYTVAGRYTEAQAMREAGADVNAQAQQQRMALLAKAAGDTAITVVGSVINPGNLIPLVATGRMAVSEYGTAAHKREGAILLNGLLDQAKAAAG